jgi:hypothetical protein
MSEEITSEMISRRATFSLLGAAVALSVAAPATPLTAAEATFGIRGAFLDFIDARVKRRASTPTGFWSSRTAGSPTSERMTRSPRGT